MALALYNPFENLHFNEKTCFLTGVELKDTSDKITVFPTWLLDRFDYHEKRFTLMDTVNSVLYKDLTIPCSAAVKEAYEVLDKEVQAAFEKGYEGMKALDEQRLFLWIGRIVYGVLYQEIVFEKERLARREMDFKISPILKERYAYFHLMLQALVSPVEFFDKKPWSIAVVRLKYSEAVFNHRDDAVNLLFSLGVDGFGIIACLQDNGILMDEQKDILDKIGDMELHPIQFEELCARVLYSNYLLQAQPKFKFHATEESLKIEALPVEAAVNQAVFSVWDNEMFEQVLQDYWSPWGLTKKDIMNDASVPISFLEDAYTFELIEAKDIPLPY